jgi:hypothetical protein
MCSPQTTNSFQFGDLDMKLFSNLALAAIVAVGAFASTAEAGNGHGSYNFCKTNYSCGKNYCSNYSPNYCYSNYCTPSYCTPSYCYPTYCQPVQPVVYQVPVVYQPQVVYQPACYTTNYCTPTYTNYCSPSRCYPSYSFSNSGCYNFGSHCFKK